MLVSSASVAFAFLQPKPRHQLHLLRSADFTCADIARAVNYYVDLGERETLREFHDLARQNDDIGRPNVNERIGWLCRILYVPKNKPLRGPMLGGLMLPYESMPLGDWPMYPVAKSGGTYCVLSEGYSLAGHAEPIPNYLTYCGLHGSFRAGHVPVPDRKVAMQEVDLIRLSKRWTKITWIKTGLNSSYTISEPWTWDRIIDQAYLIQD
ncbi:hypothetical protein [Rubripirellula obstinata]|uniref:hypothetical protein n=1 Tax=Rubripirellula obstinata TaxID=406547 RepID=UPI00135C30EC|nr:hypothetical protein [Rubripirellula obstinata]